MFGCEFVGKEENVVERLELEGTGEDEVVDGSPILKTEPGVLPFTGEGVILIGVAGS